MENNVVEIQEKNAEQVFKELIENRCKIRRANRELKTKNKKIKILGSIFVAMLLVTMFLTAINASTPTKVYSVTIVEYTVQCEDTLTSIAKKNMGDFKGDLRQYIYIVCKENNIEHANSIFPGEIIRLPVYKLEPDYFF